MPEYKKILVLRNCNMEFEREVPVFIYEPLSLAGEGTLLLIGNDLYADLNTEIPIGEYYLEFSALLNKIDSLFLTKKPLHNAIKRKIQDLNSD